MVAMLLVSGVLALLLSQYQAQAQSGQVTVCYFTNWARYRSGLINSGKDVFEMGLDGGLCTHVMYGFATVTKGDFRLVSNDPNADHPSGSEAQAQLCPAACNDPSFKPDWSDPSGVRCDWPCSPTRTYRGYEGLTVGMKRKNPAIKALISVGGWNFNDCAASSSATYGQGEATCEIFSTIAASEATSRSFAQNVIAFCRKWGFDGFDLDWEYPVLAGHNSNQRVDGAFVRTPQDYANYVRLLRILKEEFARENPSSPLLLTAAVGVGKDTADNAYDIPEMSKYLDLINLMTYDLHGAWEQRTGCNANLYATEEDTLLGGGVGAGTAVQGYPLSVSWAVDYWLQRGAPAAKLTMGLGTYGRGWKLADPANRAYNAPAVGPSAPGGSTKEAGYLAYYEVQELLRSGQATRYYDEQRQCPFVVTAAGEWIGYDDERSLLAKVDFARARGLAGTMVWALDLDDFAGAYSGGTSYPLISIARRLRTGGSTSLPPSTSATATRAATLATTTSVRPASSTASTTRSSTTSSTAATTRSSTTSTKGSTASTMISTTTSSTISTTVSTSRATSSTSASTTARPSSTGSTSSTTARQSSTAAPSGTCLRNADCAVNPWCQDLAYDSWCASMGKAGSCPLPQCTQSSVALMASKAVEAAAVTDCLRNTDCSANPWCRDTAYDSWCASMGMAGSCPLPQCVTAGPQPSPSSTVVASTSTSTASMTTRSTLSTTIQASSTPSSTSTRPSTSSSFLSTTRASSSTSSSPTTTAPPRSSSTSTRSSTATTRNGATTTPAQQSTTNAGGLVEAVLRALQSSNASGVLMYDTGKGWVESDLYRWPDMTEAVRVMATRGVGSARFWLGDGGSDPKYGLVNIAAFLAQSMQETIQYNACDENNWSDGAVVAEAGGSTYSATAACGQLHQSYQDYTCSAEEDALAGGRMACEVDPNMQLRASTQASWYGAPPKLFCAPRSVVPKAPRWDYSSPWCAPEGGWGHVAPFPEPVDLEAYFKYVNAGGSCKDYQGIKAGGWTFSGAGCVDGACPGSPAPLFGRPQGRTDVEGCCWWGRGVIQTTGVCNFGKLNYYLGKRAASEGRSALYPQVDFCRNPGAICDASSPPELKWVAGLFYWLNAVQPYSSGGWNYLAELKRWVDGGMQASDTSFIDGASGIVNRGCHNPPACGTGELHAGDKRAANFRKVLSAMRLV